MPQMVRSSRLPRHAEFGPAVTIVVLASPMSLVETTSTNCLTASTSKVASNAWTRERSPPPAQLRKGARTIFLLKAFASSMPSRNCWYWLFGPPMIMIGYRSFGSLFCATTGAAAATTHSQQRMACSGLLRRAAIPSHVKSGLPTPPPSSYPSPSSPPSRRARNHAQTPHLSLRKPAFETGLPSSGRGGSLC